MGWTPPPKVDEFCLLRPLGNGAMGQVYLGQDTLLHRQVAVKFLAVAESDAARARFLVEARAIARLAHPNVLTIYRIGEVDGHPYLVSEFVAGRSLEQLARPVPWQQALAVGQALARGLAAAHQRRVLHRDIKPANVILADDGQIKLVDFGLAKLTDGWQLGGEPDAAEARGTALPPLFPSLTLTGNVFGTPLYMAPELWRGEPASGGTDVYALGVLLYELCSGSTPHLGLSGPELSRVVCTQDATPLLAKVAAIEPHFAAIVDRCLRRDPAARFRSGVELSQALEAVGLAEPAAAPAPPESPAPGSGRVPVFAGLGLLLLLFGGVWGLKALRSAASAGSQSGSAAARSLPLPPGPAAAGVDRAAPAAPAAPAAANRADPGSAAAADPAAVHPDPPPLIARPAPPEPHKRRPGAGRAAQRRTALDPPAGATRTASRPAAPPPPAPPPPAPPPPKNAVDDVLIER